ncbi:MAG: CHASE3 domain-containing protein [Actinobacteria bacterium]|nr:CHASE3 domain-containing protein [Actinomycetota bacterium]
MIRWSLRRRLAVLLTFVGASTVAFIAVAAVAQARARGAQREVTDTYFSRLRRADSVFQVLLDQETGIREYVLSGDSRLLQPYVDGRRRQAPLVAALERAVGDDPSLRADVAAVIRAEQRWRSTVAEPMRATVAGRGLGPRPVDDARASQRGFDGVRRANAELKADLVKQRASAVTTMRRRTADTFVVLVVFAVTVAVEGAASALALRRWVTRPLDDLRAEAGIVADGDLAHEVSPSGPREVAELGRRVEEMRQRVVAEYARALESHAVAQEALVVAEERGRELERSNRDLEQFAYVASHDLQEPLRKVASFTQMLQRRYAGQLDERADQYIDFAVDGAKRMQQLINDLLAFSRVGRLGEPAEPVDLAEALEQARRALGAAIEESGAIVTADPLPTVPGERSLLVQLFQNLVSNAVKFRRDGVPPHVHVGARREGSVWELSCHDDGIGISPEYAERIFVIFQRLHSREEYDGTGIGLALCRKIVEHHGGRMWLDTSTTAGTTFRWTLPAAPARGEAASPDPTATETVTEPA